ncbi:hypothetical protein RBH26_03300 [Natronolimnohabitans sp. A-GB9]|uniref:hypothetical protein n=1 Tax=Natronolimnohabitans sp. A-GB9 TaxID=3069757 RepID=UPI0027B50018|nr:hypothetical protein [Natronolimnohabitans sp. A-GB9]MDQ2049502.1 hypothetical protein [Natronolimnohabitans sp. A-GB9]
MVDVDIDSGTETQTDTDRELGTATIVYETASGEIERVTVDNEHIAYFQDHWLFAYGTDDDGNDVVRRVPHQQVRYVERSVEELEETFESGVEKAKGKLEELTD